MIPPKLLGFFYLCVAELLEDGVILWVARRRARYMAMEIRLDKWGVFLLL